MSYNITAFIVGLFSLLFVIGVLGLLIQLNLIQFFVIALIGIAILSLSWLLGVVILDILGIKL